MNLQSSAKDRVDELMADRMAVEKFAVGQSAPRKEDPMLLRGQGHYTDDIALPGQAYAVMVRSQNGHGIIRKIDAEAARPPAGFSVNCVHARVLETALETVAATHPDACRRLLTFQANTADREVEELDGSDELLTEPAAVFAGRLERLRRRFGLRVLGGCCGTDGGHIDALARRLACEAVTT